MLYPLLVQNAAFSYQNNFFYHLLRSIVHHDNNQVIRLLNSVTFFSCEHPLAGGIYIEEFARRANNLFALTLIMSKQKLFFQMAFNSFPIELKYFAIHMAYAIENPEFSLNALLYQKGPLSVRTNDLQIIDLLLSEESPLPLSQPTRLFVKNEAGYNWLTLSMIHQRWHIFKTLLKGSFGALFLNDVNFRGDNPLHTTLQPFYSNNPHAKPTNAQYAEQLLSVKPSLIDKPNHLGDSPLKALFHDMWYRHFDYKQPNDIDIESLAMVFISHASAKSLDNANALSGALAIHSEQLFIALLEKGCCLETTVPFKKGHVSIKNYLRTSKNPIDKKLLSIALKYSIQNQPLPENDVPAYLPGFHATPPSDSKKPIAQKKSGSRFFPTYHH